MCVRKYPVASLSYCERGNCCLPVKPDSKSSLNDWGNEFGCSEDGSLSSGLPLLLNSSQSVTLDCLNKKTLVWIIILCACVRVC